MTTPIQTFSHAGKFGDIIYALPTIRAMGGGALRIHPDAGCGMTMTPEATESIGSLLSLQPYIYGVEYAEYPIGIDLNCFRGIFLSTKTLADAHLHCFDLPDTERDTAWLSVPRPSRAAQVIMSRCERYQNPRFPWDRVWQKFHDRAAFVGTAEEHAQFCKRVGPVPFEPTRNFLELAEVIAGCEVFIGNQSAPYAVAEGLKIQTLQETCPSAPNCIFPRPNATYGWDENVALPDLAR